MVAQVPQFTVTTVGRDIQIAGAREGSAYAVLDMQGRLLTSGRVPGANFSLPVVNAGMYFVRVGNSTLRVNVK